MAQTEFYTVLSRYYDELFPAEEDTVNFLRLHLNSNEPVLDAACGSGNYTHALMREGFDVYGVDSEPEMIARAGAKGHSERFFVGDMLELHELSPAPFGGIFCIGNSLSHVSTTDEVKSFVARAHDAMHAKRQLLIQVMNPERLTPKLAVPLPSLKAPGVTLHRSYTYVPELERIEFGAELVTDTGERAEVTQTLLVITEELLHQHLRDAGFSAIEAASDFLGAAFARHSSPMLVMRARS